MSALSYRVSGPTKRARVGSGGRRKTVVEETEDLEAQEPCLDEPQKTGCSKWSEGKWSGFGRQLTAFFDYKHTSLGL